MSIISNVPCSLLGASTALAGLRVNLIPSSYWAGPATISFQLQSDLH